MKFTVHGLPAPQGSKRHVGNGRMIESSKKVKPWREAVKWAALEARAAAGHPPPLEGPLSVTVSFYLPRPKTAPKRRLYPDRKPDIDKLLRSTFDAMGDAGVWGDDAQVVMVAAAKYYAGAVMDSPGALIEVTAMV
jgi:Holliday junction resolvase RusA-like endonuclease